MQEILDELEELGTEEIIHRILVDEQIQNDAVCRSYACPIAVYLKRRTQQDVGVFLISVLHGKEWYRMGLNLIRAREILDQESNQIMAAG